MRKLEVLDYDALRVLAKEDNSSTFAVDAHHRGIKRLGDLSPMLKLYSLDVSFNELKSLENIHTAKDLKELKVYNNKLASAAGLKGNQNVEVLVMSDNEIPDIPSDFTSLFKLKTLQLHGNKIARIENLKTCRHLTYLDLSRNRITGAWTTALQSLAALEFLNLSDNQISSIGSLDNLSKLEELNLAGNSLSSLAGTYPPHLTAYAVLRVDRNKIADLKTLPILPNLNEFYVQCNLLSDISCVVDRLPQLESIDVRNNRLRGLNDVACLARCTVLEDLWVRGNPCTLSDSYLVDMANALPAIHFIDDLALKQIQESPNPQKLAESAARPPSAGRPATPLSRPSSTGSQQRPTSGDGRPLVFKPSSRAGAQTKMLSPVEVEKAQNDVRDRLHKLRHLMGKMCGEPRASTSGKSKSPPKKSQLVSSPPRPNNQLTSTERIESVVQITVENSPPLSSFVVAQVEPPSKGPLVRPKTCEMGTDPLDDIPMPRPHTSSTRSQRREGEIQTMPVSDGVMKLSSATNSVGVDIMMLDGNELLVEGEDPVDVEDAMKMHLIAGLKTDDVVVTLRADEEDLTSPRVEPWRRAEARPRPTPEECTGFRLFRIPESARRFMQSATSAT
ncbi:Aste57867_8746 [Aphanomyces stellatus]|uniref:Aste57867_8746 protein n=1 Tax=Aphanomyces stellatus TaxID=120398 RepID=A0A485KL15_9STRA|nr:hypothetical protein As57867_008712 [Aphanomyces stellatus]VFT85632.1 Aste57867_8746 [Aphanomyces stellatus]